MFRKVVVGVDGRTGGRDAISSAQQLVAAGGELTLANVHPGGRRGSHDGLQLLEQQRAWAQVEAQLRTPVSSSVATGLHALAESLEADLLVIGSSHRGRLGRVFIGDDTRAALTGAPCAVAVAPAGYVRSRRELREIGVGYDRSPASEQALAVGRRLAAATHAKLSALEVVSLPTQEYLGGVYNFDAAIERVIDQAVDRLTALGGLEPRAAYGIPSRELARYSDAVDLLIVGSRGLGRTGRLLLGSTSQDLARSCGCPLLVVGHPAGTAGSGLDQAVLERVANQLGA